MSYLVEILADNPLLYWRLNEPSGTTAVDSSPNNLPGTYHGTPTLNVTSPFVGDPSAAAITCVSSSSQYVERADNALINFGSSAPFSTEIWFKTLTKQDKALISKGGAISASESGYELYLRSAGAGQIQACIAAAGGANQVAFNYVVAYNDGLWHHVLFTRSVAGTLNLYYDGVFVATGGNSTIDTTSTRIFGVGARATTPSDLIDASLAEVAIYGTALSASRILAHYNAAFNLIREQYIGAGISTGTSFRSIKKRSFGL